MFEWLFKYPPAAYAHGKLVLMGPQPLWWLGVALAAAALLFGGPLRRRMNARGEPLRRAALWLLQCAFAAVVLLLVWQPALSVSTLKPRQNVVAVLIDDSRSMRLRDPDGVRIEQARQVLARDLLGALTERFQVRLYRFGDGLTRIAAPEQVTGAEPATHIAEALRALASETAQLPLGAVVLLSDGADTRGGVDRETIAQLRSRRLPVHTVGFGRERFARDVEIAGVELAARTLPGARVSATLRLRQDGYNRSRVRLSVQENGKTLAWREVALAGGEQTETLTFAVGAAGPHRFEFIVDGLPQEENPHNNRTVRLVQVEDRKPRVLYMEGEPRWEFKFIRRALEEDAAVQLTTLLRTTENKLYRQGILEPKELEQGFPASAEELFAFSGLILGSVEASYFTAAQQELIREFADRRGGGVLWLGGRRALSEGGWNRPPLADLLPVSLPDRQGTFHRDRVQAVLTPAGRESLICRLEDPPERNLERWRRLPALADYQEVGEAKPGAVVLAELESPQGRRLPLLVTQNYGHGRTALFATGGSWRWQMLQPLSDLTHEMFWRQLVRWLVAGAPGPVSAGTPSPVLEDEDRVLLRAEVRDKAFRPVSDAQVQARILGPESVDALIELRLRPDEPGVYEAEWKATRAGGYSAEVVARRGEETLGRDTVLFRREDGVAEHFRAVQNRELLETLARETGGRYYRPAEAAKLAQEISYSEAGITVREMRELWDAPFVFLLILGLRSAEWLLRRKWGAV